MPKFKTPSKFKKIKKGLYINAEKLKSFKQELNNKEIDRHLNILTKIKALKTKVSGKDKQVMAECIQFLNKQLKKLNKSQKNIQNSQDSNLNANKGAN